MTHHVHVIDHPLVQHKLTMMRQQTTTTSQFRELMREISLLLGYEVTRSMTTSLTTVETPLCKTQSPLLDEKQPAIIPIMRAGLGLLDGLLQLLPAARIGHVGMYRDSSSNNVIEYYCKFPVDIKDRRTFVVDPLLATGGTAIASLNRVKEVTSKNIVFICLIASPEGITALKEHHNDIPIYTASIDETLNEKQYILPGLGDAGDRLFGTL